MEVLRIIIEELKTDMTNLTIKVDDFSRHGRSPSNDERLEQTKLLSHWMLLLAQLQVCEELMQAINSNF